MRFERTSNSVLVTMVLSHPKIYDAIADDGCPAREQFTFQTRPGLWPIVASDGPELLGLFLFEPRNAVEWTVHTCLLPNAWGRKRDGGGRALAAAKGVIQWIWQNTTCRRITTHVPEYNRLALRFAKQAGLIEYGFNPKSWVKHGRLHGQIELGISKE